MSYEVEVKYRVSEVNRFKVKLSELGAVPKGVEHQVDDYRTHPARDFAQTDEAFRIRSVGERTVLTYKGPKIDKSTKTRREVEVALAPGDASRQAAAELFGSLGFATSACVVKERQMYALTWRDRDWDICIDSVRELGTFVELETLAEESEVDSARKAIEELARTLDLSQQERRGYIELFLAIGDREVSS